MNFRVPFARPIIGEEEIAEVADTLRSGWLTGGPKTRRFEEAFARSIGVAHAVGTSSCTGALHVALAALGVGTGDEVIVPAMTFAATAHVVVHQGARPVFADVTPGTLNIDPAEVERRITARTRAIMAVHYAGRPCEMDQLRAIASARRVHLVEDAAHGIGGAWQGTAIGALGDAAAFSFYANKNFTTGEGGMMTTASPELAERARVLRLQGMSRDSYHRAEDAGRSWHYDVVAAGFKYPMSDINAAIGLHQLPRLAGFQEARRRIVARYRAGLAALPGLELPPAEAPGTTCGWHLFVVQIDPGARRGRDALFAGLAERGIECSVHFVPLPLHPYFRDTWGTRPGQFPVAEAAYQRVLSLPLWPGLSDGDADYVIEAIRALLSA